MPTKPRLPPREQIIEWTENPVTLVFKQAVLHEIELLEEGSRSSNVFHPFDALKTQEILTSLNAAIDTWEDTFAALEGEGVMREYSDEDETDE